MLVTDSLAPSRALAVLLLASSVGACAAHHHLYFDPEIVGTELRGKDDDLQARLVVIWRGVTEREGVPELRFRVRAENPGSMPFTLAPAVFELLDGSLSSFGSARVLDLPASVAANRSVTFDRAFPVPAGKQLQGFDLENLTLRVWLEGRRWEWSAEFQHDYKSNDPG